MAENMYIQKLIQSRLEQSVFSITDKAGRVVPNDQILAEFNSIKNYLLNNIGNQDGSIAIKLEKDYAYFLVILGCLELGITYIPMKSDYPDSRVQQILEDSKFSILITSQNINEILNYQEKSHFKIHEFGDDHVAYILFTSGSTGRPKGVEIQRKALANFFKWIELEFKGINEKDHLLQVTEFTFDISLVDVGAFLTKNTKMYFSNFNNNILKLAFEIEKNSITFLNTVPNNLNMLLSDVVLSKANYTSLKHMFIAGSRFSFGLYQKCIKVFKPHVNIYNCYGPTESTVYSHWKKLEFNKDLDLIEQNVAIGKPLLNLFSVILADGKPAQPFERGELLLGGVQLLKSYINNEEQTKNAIVEFEGQRFYKSGDVAFIDNKNEYYIVGRTDDTIKYRGFRINLLDIDSYILKVPYVQDVATIAIENEHHENITVGFVIMKEQKNVKDFKKDLSEYLLDYQIPEKIIFVEQFPVNNSGKVDRKMLKNEYLNKGEK